MINVMIVEDQSMPRQLFELFVKSSDKYNLLFSIENAGMAEIYCMKHPIDLILMDVLTAGGENGLEAAESIKKNYPHIKIILVIPYRDFRIFNDSLFDEIIYPFETHTFSYYTYKGNIPKRNRWAVDHSSVAICYVYRAGGAEKTLKYAKNQKLRIIDLTKGA